ncbi:MAG: DNA mismatch repair protein MutS [Planctomycetota bacterium]|nr:MAG: DNA mismatch repair protein MutS [Planctomycetota bacterium]
MTTPMFEQYARLKAKLKDEILFFRMGDFYEMFYEDAQIASKVLGIALTTRSNGKTPVPMAGVPHHSVHAYLKKFIQAGYKVAICEQVEDPKQAKGVVKREIVRILTPGTLLEEELLEEKSSNFLLAIFLHKNTAGLSWLDISTGDFFATDLSASQLFDEVDKIAPKECILPTSFRKEEHRSLRQSLEQILDKNALTYLEDWHFDPTSSKRRLRELLGVKSLKGYGIQGKEVFLSCCGALIEYIESTQPQAKAHIKSIQKLQPSHYMQLDIATQRTLELVRTMRGNSKKFTLLHTIDRTQTPMGNRLLQHWLLHPLVDLSQIQRRQDAVCELFQNGHLCDQLQASLKSVYDVERLCSKISTQNATPRDLVSLRLSLEQLPQIHGILAQTKSCLLRSLYQDFDLLEDVHGLLEKAIHPRPPLHLQDGGVIQAGYHPPLDRLRQLAQQGQQWLQEYQRKEAARTNIPSLKVGFNNVFGYYIEITHAHAHKVPEDYVRKQTLKNAERYITPELKEFETQVLTAREKAIELEVQLFQQIRSEVAQQLRRLQKTAVILATLDCLQSLAKVAQEHRYHPPTLVSEPVLDIQEGRHPVLEQVVEEPFVPNDLKLHPRRRLLILTGPNMAGKSTFIRQVALICILAQMGSFVPAKSARIGVVDKLFTRLGSNDELYRGLSTFMVEMLETAQILNHATSQSLVLLDEVGRGTSTYDGISLAWAISEYVHNQLGCRCLFATHYHELTQLERQLPYAFNNQVAIQEWKDRILFLHKIQDGYANKSYGIHVAKLAGIPPKILHRAKQILKALEDHARLLSPQLSLFEGLFAEDSSSDAGGVEGGAKEPGASLSPLSSVQHQILEELQQLQPDHITPLEALQRIQKWHSALAQRENCPG